MKKPPRPPAVPRNARETLRQAIREELKRDSLTARDISAILGIREKEVYLHLEHIRRSLHGKGETLEVAAAECRTCGFVFAKRARLTPPGKCPVCRKEAISDPRFQIIG